MVTKPLSYVEQFDSSLATWTDERFVSREDLRALSMFSVYLVNLADADGWVYDGHSFKVGAALGCLVIKATMDDAPVVSFISGRTFINCVKIFLRRLDSDTVEWRKDKFRG